MPLTPTNYLFHIQYIYYIQKPSECVDILSSREVFSAGALEARVCRMSAFRPPENLVDIHITWQYQIPDHHCRSIWVYNKFASGATRVHLPSSNYYYLRQDSS